MNVGIDILHGSFALRQRQEIENHRDNPTAAALAVSAIPSREQTFSQTPRLRSSHIHSLSPARIIF
jgi:hypothetical protein